MFMQNLGSFFTPPRIRIRIHGLKISRILTDPDPDPKHCLQVNNIRENGQEEGVDQPVQDQAAAEPLRLDPLLVAVNFVTAFFTSIIPDQNQVI